MPSDITRTGNVHCAWEAMGSRFEMFLRGADEAHLRDVALAVEEEVMRLDGALSRFDPRSEIARLNREAPQRATRVDRELFALLERCERARQQTGGAFDITGRAALELCADDRTVRLTQPDAQIDLGGVGKGYALDRGAELLRQFKIESALLQGGTSSILAVGDAAWPIDLRSDTMPVRIELADRGFSCSAVRHPGQPESDLFDPATGQPLAGDDAVAVIAATATDAELLSTALLVMGRERAKQCLSSLDKPPAAVCWLHSQTGPQWIVKP